MELSHISAILTMAAAANIFYAMYGVAQHNWLNTLIPIFSFLILIFSAAMIEENAEKLRIAARSKTK